MIRLFWGTLSLIFLTLYAVYLGVFGDTGPPKVLRNMKSYASAGFSSKASASPASETSKSTK